MNKKIFYTLSIGAFVIMLLSLAFIFLKPRYSNVFEEIYHDEYHHTIGSWLSPTASTLESLPDMEKKRTRGLLYGVTGEGYKGNNLPKNIDGIFYTFSYPDNELVNGQVSIVINIDLPNSDI